MAEMDIGSGEARKRIHLSQQQTAAILAFLFLLLGIAVVWLAKGMMDVDRDAIFVSLLLIPILMFVIMSGRLTELKTPGGLEAKFAQVAREAPDIAAESIGSEALQVVEKGGIPALQAAEKSIDPTKPVVMTIKLGIDTHYTVDAFSMYLTMLSQFRTFRIIVFEDDIGGVVGYMRASAAKALVDYDGVSREFIDCINDAALTRLRRYPGFMTKTLSARSSKSAVLREMTQQDMDIVVLVDAAERLAGLVEREQLIGRVLLRVIGADEA